MCVDIFIVCIFCCCCFNALPSTVTHCNITPRQNLGFIFLYGGRFYLYIDGFYICYVLYLNVVSFTICRAFPCVCVLRVLHCRSSFQSLRCSVYHHHHHHVGNQQADVFLMRNSSVYGTNTESKAFFFFFGFVFYSARFYYSVQTPAPPSDIIVSVLSDLVVASWPNTRVLVSNVLSCCYCRAVRGNTVSLPASALVSFFFWGCETKKKTEDFQVLTKVNPGGVSRAAGAEA